MKDTNSDLRQTAIVNSASKSHSSGESGSNIQTIPTVGAAQSADFSSYNPYMSRSMYSSSFLSGEGSKSIQTLMSGGGSSAENHPAAAAATAQQSQQGMSHYPSYTGYPQAGYAQASQQYSAQGQYPGYPQQGYPTPQQVPGQGAAYPQGTSYPPYQQGQQYPGQYPAVTTVSQANYNMAPGLPSYQQQQMMNPRGATTSAPRGPSASRSSKPQSQQQQPSVNQNLAMVRITGR